MRSCFCLRCFAVLDHALAVHAALEGRDGNDACDTGEDTQFDSAVCLFTPSLRNCKHRACSGPGRQQVERLVQCTSRSTLPAHVLRSAARACH